MTKEDLRALRQTHALTQRAMAAELGYHENYLRRLENGHEPITPRFEKLVQVLFGKGKRKKVSPSS